VLAWLLVTLAIAAAIWFTGAFLLRGADQREFDQPKAGDVPPQRQQFSSGDALNAEHRAVVTSLGGIKTALKGTPHIRHLGVLRTYMDNMTANRTFDAQFTSVDAGGVAAEWVIAPGADSKRRTLYIHGGAWMMGSPRSHRVITAKFSEITGGAVLAIDYRLMPEHSRMDGIADCRSSYRWILENGPDGAGLADTIFVAGDSAGGNLTLSLIAWVRDQGLRAPDAAVALSPATDATLGSPSLRTNVDTDALLGPLFGKLARVPRSVLLWMGLFQNRMQPRRPVISPLFGNLSGLPPTLIQASSVEMLLDDSVRYANKASAAGSQVTLQTWNHVVHVWHIFDPELTEAREAFDEIRKFLAQHR
jgi:monoterpene epsilon-lactone hydrolase